MWQGLGDPYHGRELEAGLRKLALEASSLTETHLGQASLGQ